MADDEAWVIDTSSVIAVTEGLIPRPQMPRVYARLGALVEKGSLFFPRQVYDELDRYSNPNATQPDLPYEWARQHLEQATRLGTDYGLVKMVLAAVPDVLDKDKARGVEEADPYVLALALQLVDSGHSTRIITQERHDRPDRMSMTTAGGILNIPCIPLDAFLRLMGILN